MSEVYLLLPLPSSPRIRKMAGPAPRTNTKIILIAIEWQIIHLLKVSDDNAIDTFIYRHRRRAQAKYASYTGLLTSLIEHNTLHMFEMRASADSSLPFHRRQFWYATCY